MQRNKVLVKMQQIEGCKCFRMSQTLCRIVKYIVNIVLNDYQMRTSTPVECSLLVSIMLYIMNK